LVGFSILLLIAALSPTSPAAISMGVHGVGTVIFAVSAWVWRASVIMIWDLFDRITSLARLV
jgi:hypothetical protein